MDDDEVMGRGAETGTFPQGLERGSKHSDYVLRRGKRDRRRWRAEMETDGNHDGVQNHHN